jgi:hypothetical protein
LWFFFFGPFVIFFSIYSSIIICHI